MSEVTAFIPNIDEVFRTQRGSSFSLYKEGGGHRSFADVTMNVSLRWERGDCIRVMVFLRGHVAQAARCLARGSMARVRSLVSKGVEIFFTPSYTECSWGPLSPL